MASSKSLLKNYELLSTTRDFSDTITTHAPEYCRFCKKKFPEATFNTTSHLIPEIFGKNNTKVLDECDECNNKFSKYESHLYNFLSPYLSLIAAKGKKGYTSFNSRADDRENRTVIRADQFNRQIDFGTNTDDFRYDHENKLLHINLRKQSYIPLFVYKALMRIGLALLPLEYLNANEHYTSWLLSDEEDDLTEHPFLTCFFTHLGNRSFTQPWAELYKATEIVNGINEYPEFSFVISSYNIAIQIFLPPSISNASKHVKGNSVSIEVFPAVIWQRFADQANLSFTQMHWGSNKKSQENEWITFKYESLNGN